VILKVWRLRRMFLKMWKGVFEGVESSSDDFEGVEG